MTFGAHSVAVIEGGDTALRESSSGELTDPPWRPGPDVSRCRSRTASVIPALWAPHFAQNDVAGIDRFKILLAPCLSLPPSATSTCQQRAEQKGAPSEHSH